MADTGQERTETATPQRVSEARKDGNVARSTDLTAACSLMMAVILLDMFGGRLMVGIRQMLEMSLSGVIFPHLSRADDTDAYAMFVGYISASAMAPIIVGIAAVTLIATVLQVGFLVTVKPLQPDLSKLSPLKGFSNIFGARGGMRFVMSVLKVIIIGAVAVVVINGQMPQILRLAELDLRPMILLSWELVYELSLKLAAILMILAILDYAYQKWQHMKDLRMTKQEIKEDMKRMDGDPTTRQRRARVAKQLAMQRIASAVPNADVVVTNPTHFAIALKYDPEKMTAPVVVAKGADFMALRIRQLAIANDVPLVERKTLARAMYSSVEVNQEIPAEFFTAVAEILAYVYRLSGRKSA